MKEIALIDEKHIKNNLVNLRQIVFEVTETCNLNCRYCGLSDLYQTFEVRQNRNMPFKTAQLVIDHFFNLWRENQTSDTMRRLAISFYGGEPLINMPLIKKIIDYVEQSGITGRNIFYNMTTNGMLLDKHMDYLAEKKIKLLISLDGDETSQSYRVDHYGKNSFHQVIHNVK